MILSGLFLFGSLLLILATAESFTNGVESFGRHFSFSQAVVGSIFAAVGTALPETVLPIVAILLYGGKSAKEIGVGAILGAPFMLSTLAFFLVGLTAAVAALRKRRRFELRVEVHSVRRDLSFFLIMYSLAIALPLVFGRVALIPLSLALVAGYAAYAFITFRSESATVEHAEGLYLWRMARTLFPSGPETAPLSVLLIQIFGSLAVMVKAAHIFVRNLEQVSLRLGMDPLLFALLLAPVATELPEKFNSVTWTWKGRDTLAIGNITGAMVFQSTFPVSVGLLFTDWRITGMALFSAVIAITSSVFVLGMIAVQKRLSPWVMLLSGSLYLVYAVGLVIR